MQSTEVPIGRDRADSERRVKYFAKDNCAREGREKNI